jgi:hypothetical protein
MKINGYIMTYKIKLCLFIALLLTYFVLVGFSQWAISAGKRTGKNESKKENVLQKEKCNPYEKAKITTRIISSVNKTFGYEIVVNGKTLVRQPNIPALPGNDGFTTKKRAQRVADFVVRRIRNNEMPPTVTVEDLQKMGVLKKIEK